jgi:predicted ester cyclase
MDRSEAERIATRWASEGVAEGRTQVFDELVSAEAIDHSGPVDVRGVEGFKVRTTAVHAALSRITVRVEDVLVDGERMAWRWLLTGTHSGPFAGVPATGKRVTMSGMNIQRVASGKVVEHWSNADQLGLVRQMQAP